MTQSNHHFSPTDIPILADRILGNFKRDFSYFEQYSPKFNYEFLASFEDKVNRLLNLVGASQTSNDRNSQSKEKIALIINSFNPLLDILRSFLRSNFPKTGLRVSDFRLNEVREALNKKCVWEVQRSCLKLIGQLEDKFEDFIDKGFMSVLIADFHFLIKKLGNLEDELAEVTHQQGMVSDEYRYIDNQVVDFLNTIVESTTAVFGEDDCAKRDDYTIEKLMIQSQFNRNDIQ